MSLAYEADHVFTNLLCLGEHEQHVPVVVKLGHDCLQIASVCPVKPNNLIEATLMSRQMQKQDLGASLKAFIIDVIHLNDIDDIISDSGLMTDQLVIRHSQNESITFTSRSKADIWLRNPANAYFRTQRNGAGIDQF